MSQKTRILTWLEERGATGVHSFEFIEAGMPRGAAVICSLKKAGYDIASREERFYGKAHGKRYFLRSAATLVPAAPKPSRAPQLVGGGRPSGSQYDPYSEFA